MPLPFLVPIAAALASAATAATGAAATAAAATAAAATTAAAAAAAPTAAAAVAATAAVAVGTKKAIESIEENGRIKGKKEGIAEASREYEQKLLKQGDEFLKQKKILKEQLDELYALLKQCEDYFEKIGLNASPANSKTALAACAIGGSVGLKENDVVIMYRKLKKLAN